MTVGYYYIYHFTKLALHVNYLPLVGRGFNWGKVCDAKTSVHLHDQGKNLQPYQVDTFFILEGIEKLWYPGTAIQCQDPPLFFMKNHLRRIEKSNQHLI